MSKRGKMSIEEQRMWLFMGAGTAGGLASGAYYEALKEAEEEGYDPPQSKFNRSKPPAIASFDGDEVLEREADDEGDQEGT